MTLTDVLLVYIQVHIRYTLHTAALKSGRVNLSQKLGMHLVCFWLMSAWVKWELNLPSKVKLKFLSLHWLDINMLNNRILLLLYHCSVIVVVEGNVNGVCLSVTLLQYNFAIAAMNPVTTFHCLMDNGLLKYTSNVPARGAGTSTPKVMTRGKTTATPKITFFANC